jgi:methylmalonyl-CoA mutase cobalamin-binding domain/chain
VKEVGKLVRESMSVEERSLAAIALEQVDRHPVFPILVTAAPRLYGITQAEAWRKHEVARDAIIRCYKEFGYDFGSKPNYYYPQLPGKLTGAPVRNLIPGKQIGEDDLYQIDERVLFPREDYDQFAALGWNGYWEARYPKMSGKTIDQLTFMQKATNQLYYDDLKICESQGVPIFMGVAVDSVMMAFSLCRTLTEFTRDLHEVPGKVEAALRASCDDLISTAIQVCKSSNKMLAFIVLERGSGFYYRLDVFERFEWPFLQRYVDAFLAEGIIPWLHLDTDWGINLPCFTKLPKGKCVCDLDGTTDIFRAKEILKGHMCISGDVPAALLSLGKPEEVEAYCKRLIDEVGEGGGFMLTTGCECPINVKRENLRAMVETGKSYAGKKGRAGVIRRVEKKVEAPGVSLPRGKIAEALGRLKYDEVEKRVSLAIQDRRNPLEILEECREGMETVGKLYSSGEYFLAELIMSADLFKKVVGRVEPLLSGGKDQVSLESVVIGTPKGDIHDIGKNIVATLFKASGFQVHDLGVDVPPETFVQKVAETEARVVAMSALITPTFESMKKVVDLLKEKKIREDRFVILGGGPTTKTVQDYVGADAWSLDPKAGVDLCKNFVAGK